MLPSSTMSKQLYTNQTITEYLLGSLGETETERFDELSITSDEFAEALNATEKELVDAYVQGALTGAELERFKFHYLASPMRREKVYFAQAFQVLAERNPLAPGEDGAKPSKKRKTSGWFSELSVFTDRHLALQWGFAAMALAFLIAGGWLAFENVRLRQQVSQAETRRDALGQREQELQKELVGQRSASAKAEQELAQVTEERRRLEEEIKTEGSDRQVVDQQRATKQQQAPASSRVSIASFVLVPQMRDAGQIQTLSIPADKNFVEMRLDLEPGDHATYRVALLNQSNNQALWRSGKLRGG